MTTPSPSERIIGYVTPRPFGPFAMPVPAQNSCLREYATQMGLTYVLPQCEHIFKNCYVQLFGTLNGAPEDGQIVMYSFHMLPDAAANLEKLFEIQREKTLAFHFVLEKDIKAPRRGSGYAESASHCANRAPKRCAEEKHFG